jgi:FkbH-like protein
MTAKHVVGEAATDPTLMAPSLGSGRDLVIAATFAADPIATFLRYWLRRERLEVGVSMAPYGQVLEQVALASSELNDTDVDLGVILIRIEDYLRVEEGCLDSGATSAKRDLAELALRLEERLRSGGGPILLGVMPVMAPALDSGFVECVVSRLRESVDAHRSASWIDVDDALDLYRVRSVTDPLRNEIAHIPFSDEFMAAVGTVLARKARALWGEPRKVIALDCDDTLWGGACSEDPIEELDATGPFSYLRKFMCEQAEAGRLLCLISRNRPEDVAAAFSRYAAPLTSSHIVAQRFGWGAKSESLRSLADELNVDVDSFVFVDDDPLECEEVRARLPGVTVVQLPVETEAIPLTLRHVWELDLAFVTEDDRQRSRAYAANRRLKAELRDANDSSFLKGLNVRVEVTLASGGDLDRVAQLFSRTNQFNSTGQRLSLSDLRRLVSGTGSQIWTVRVADRLGEYGLVGAVLTSRTMQEMRVEHIALSCRVFNRGVERSMFAALLSVADPPPKELVIAFRATERNAPVRCFLEEIGVERDPDEQTGKRWFSVSPLELARSS